MRVMNQKRIYCSWTGLERKIVCFLPHPPSLSALYWIAICSCNMDNFIFRYWFTSDFNSGRLRARQKERIAQRHTITTYTDDKLEEFMKSYNPIADERENPLVIVEEPNSSQPSGSKRFSESTAEMKQSSKKSKRYAEVPQDFYSSKHHSKSTDVLNPGTQHHLLPVLGLYAPNADQTNLYKNSSCGSSMKEQKRLVVI